MRVRRVVGLRWAWLAVAGCVGGGPYEANVSVPPIADRPPTLEIDVDEDAKVISVRMGPFVPHVGAADHDTHGNGPDPSLSPLMRFAWPVDGWLRGFSVRLLDRGGNELPRDILHHVIGVNFDRRQLVYPALERFVGVGTETGDIELPAELGVPMAAGQQLGLYASLHDETGRGAPPVEVLVTMSYTPRDERDDVKDVLPIYLDTNHHVGATNAWDLPPGRSERTWEFTVPVSGDLLGVSGHLHDHGRHVRLEDAETDEVLVELEARRDRQGRVEEVETRAFRKWLGLRWDPLRLEAGHLYRVVGVYDSPLADTVPNGAMAHIVGVFAPDDVSRWPSLDLDNDSIRLDIAALPTEPGAAPSVGGDAGADHVH